MIRLFFSSKVIGPFFWRDCRWDDWTAPSAKLHSAKIKTKLMNFRVAWTIAFNLQFHLTQSSMARQVNSSSAVDLRQWLLLESGIRRE